MGVLVVSGKGQYLCAKEEAGKVRKGGFVEGLWWVDGDDAAKMTQEGIDESCLEVVGGGWVGS